MKANIAVIRSISFTRRLPIHRLLLLGLRRTSWAWLLMGQLRPRLRTIDNLVRRKRHRNHCSGITATPKKKDTAEGGIDIQAAKDTERRQASRIAGRKTARPSQPC
jgi:hypothetical protein